MERREVLQTLGTFLASRPLAAHAGKPHRRILLFSRSVLFEHSVIARAGDQLSFAERAFVELAKEIGCDVECSKDGRVFDQDIDRYAAIVSYTCGRPADLMKVESKDHSAPVSERGYRNLDRAVRAGKPLVGIHPGIWFLPEAMGANCLGHGSQQVGKMLVSSPQFPGLQGLSESFSFLEEWFSLTAFAKDLHVILVQDCAGMDKRSPADKRCYDRSPFPATWARMHDKGRVFYTSMGHREDVWTNRVFQRILLGGLRWALGDVAGDIKPNLAEVAPHANDVAR